MLTFLNCSFYIRISPDWLSVRHIQSGTTYEDAPFIAIAQKTKKNSIIAVGRKAEAMKGMPNINVVNGFKHPRTILADFTSAEMTLKYFLKYASPKSLFLPSPIAVLHPTEELDGGFTQIEIRALAELGSIIGARKVYLWVGSELSDDAIKQLKFPPFGGKLLFP